MSAGLQNWAGNIVYSTDRILYPEGDAELAALVGRAKALRVLGTRHSFNTISDSNDTLVSLARFERSMRIDAGRQQAVVSANVTYGDLCPILHRAGWAVHNMASLPHISVVGACMTATHGSGSGNRGLAAQVAGIRFVTAAGEMVSLTREMDGGDFAGAVMSLGALGVAVEVTLDLLPAFDVHQRVYLDLPFARLDSEFDAIMSSAYSVSLFTDWTGDTVNQVWLKERTDSPRGDAGVDFANTRPATREMHPIASMPADNCTAQLGVPGPWHERLPHFRIDATPSAGAELQSEYFVAREHGVEALRAVRELGPLIAPHLLISEIRTIAADDFWMSPCYGQDSVGIHFTWKPDWSAVRAVLPQIEAALAPFDARPHWGKLFTMAPARVRALYSMLPRFLELVERYDPQGKFRNEFLRTYLYGG